MDSESFSDISFQILDIDSESFSDISFQILDIDSESFSDISFQILDIDSESFSEKHGILKLHVYPVQNCVILVYCNGKS